MLLATPAAAEGLSRMMQGLGRRYVARFNQRHRAITDYVAGMTDRYALREHERLTGRTLFP